MPFNYTQINLPVREAIPEVQDILKEQNTLILKAPTGAGKSTLLPLALLEEEWLKGQKIYLLEPRRLAAKAIAHRMADLLGEKVGETVGYRVRFESKVSENTRLEILTEGILTRMIQQDNSLEGVGMVIFDEFHERSIHADLAMAFCRESQQVLREDLRLLIMSATIDMPQLAKVLDDAPIVESKGRQYPVDVHYVGDSDVRMLPEMAANVVATVVKKCEGDTLVFLPGQGEIMKCADLLKAKLPGFQIHPLFGQLPPNKQFAAIMPDKEGRRKVVIATNIAETSLTIEGIKIVVDSGFARVGRFNPNSGLTKLETVKISKENADQRKGRAGRLSEGVCFRMWSKATDATMLETAKPEIETADLSSLLLDLSVWGINDANELAWVTPPPFGHLQQAKSLLMDLEAIENDKITEHGKDLHQLPTHPRIAHMLLFAKEEGEKALALACDVAALLEEKDPLPKDSGIDINLRIEALRRFRKTQQGFKRLKQIEKIAAQYRSLFKLKEDNEHYDHDETGLLLAYAYPERIACARPGNNAQFQLANGKIAMAGHRDDLAHESWLVAAHVAERESGTGKIFMAASLNPTDLQPLLRTKDVIRWDSKDGKLIASTDLRIGQIVLKSTPIQNPDQSLLQQAIIEAVQKEGHHLLDWNDEVVQWQNRILSIRKWNGKGEWPDVSQAYLLVTCEQWLSPYLTNVRLTSDLKKINLKEILHYSLDISLQQELEALTPERIEVPSGSNIKLQYQADGSAPVLAVRLAECFGMTDTPKVNNGEQGVLMHLLSPGYKPVQITSDLASFWKEAYFEVRKELRVKYKKHSWPEDPINAEALRGAKRRKG